jgi:hypothetical protein
LPPQAHAAAYLLNTMLGAEGHTVDASRARPPEPLAWRDEVSGVLREASRGGFSAAIFWQANPAYAFLARVVERFRAFSGALEPAAARDGAFV